MEISQEPVIEIHQMSLTLPKVEMYEEGQKIRRSLKSVNSTIVEGYGRRDIKRVFKFLIYTHASNDETIDHLETLCATKSLLNQALFSNLMDKLDVVGRKLNNFIPSVEKEHLSVK